MAAFFVPLIDSSLAQQIAEELDLALILVAQRRPQHASLCLMGWSGSPLR
jgi:hypothetical protein